MSLVQWNARQWAWEHRRLIETLPYLDAYLQREDCGFVCRLVWTLSLERMGNTGTGLDPFPTAPILNYNPRMRQLVGKRWSLAMVTFNRRIWHWQARKHSKSHFQNWSEILGARVMSQWLRARDALAEDPASTWHQITIVITLGPGGLTPSPNTWAPLRAPNTRGTVTSSSQSNPGTPSLRHSCQSWGEGFSVKSTCCSYWVRIWFSLFPSTHVVARIITPVPEDLTPCSDLWGHQAHMCTGKTLVHIKKYKIKKKIRVSRWI